jgi:Xaa-Pro aminopeptidase
VSPEDDGGHPHRIDRLCAFMADEGLEVVVAAGAETVNHLCGYWRYFGFPAGLVVGHDGLLTLVVQVDEREGALEEGSADEVATYGSRGFGLVPDQRPLLAAAVAQLPRVAAAARLGVASDGDFAQLLGGHVRASICDAGPTLRSIRLVKDPDELARILAAYELAWTAQEAVRRQVRPGVAEIELFTTGLSAAQLAGGEPIAFLADLLSGPRTADVCAPIRVAGRRRLAAGDAVVADLVVGLRGYWGDTAETLVAGTNAAVESVRAELLEILDHTAQLLTPGRTGADVYAAMRAEIAASFPDGEFPHHGGHGVGLSSFEDPHMIPGDTTPLEAGMVIALEPGVYFAGRFGARTEKMFVVRPDGGSELRQATVAGDSGP